MNRKTNDKARTLLAGCVALLAAVTTAMTAHAENKRGLPGDSRYTLELTPFAKHAGENAIDLTFPPDGSGRVFVSTQSGQVLAFDKRGNPLGTFLDLAKSRPGFFRTAGSFNGLMYIAFHPDYARRGEPGFGRFYTGHQVKAGSETADYDSKDVGAAGDSDVRFVVAEWRVDPGDPNRIDPASYRRVLLLNFHTTASNPHALGELAFNPYAKPGGPDYGLLYIAVGDSNHRNESEHTDYRYVQKLDNPFAKILRIDPLPKDGKPYAIPTSNPFGNEAFAIGLRNPQSFSFALDFEGKPFMIAFDVGAAKAEEVNFIRIGRNYGWDRYEGTQTYTADRELHSPAHPPAVQYGHAFQTRAGEKPKGGPAAIIGGFVVSDPDDPSFKGQIVFADLPRGTLFHANLHHALTVEQTGTQSRPYVMNARLGDKVGSFADVIGADRGDVRFGVDEAGTLYLVSKQTSTIFKTRLIYTGEPVEAMPRLQQQEAGGLWGAVGTIGTVLVLLTGQLVFVWRHSKREPMSNAPPPLKISNDEVRRAA